MKPTEYIKIWEDEEEKRRIKVMKELDLKMKKRIELKNMECTFAKERNADSFWDCNNERRDIDNDICTLAEDSRQRSIPEESLIKVLHDYTKEYNGEFTQKYNKYLEDVKKLYVLYMELAQMQNEALKELECCNKKLSQNTSIPDEVVMYVCNDKAPYHGFNILTADLSLFESYGLIDYEKGEKLRHITADRVHVEDFDV